MKTVIKTLVFCLTVSAINFAHADLIWDWQFEQVNLGILAPKDTVQGRAVLKNDLSSSKVLDLSYMWGGASIRNVLYEGQDAYFHQTGFGSAEPFPWPFFSHSMRQIILTPGQTATFDFIWDKSLLPEGFWGGNYSVNALLRICPIDCSKDSFETWQYKERTLQWSIAEPVKVPESNSAVLLLTAFGLMGLIRRRK